MLNAIREKILQQKAIMEATEIILEDAGMNLDDSIVLGEAPEELELPGAENPSEEDQKVPEEPEIPEDPLDAPIDDEGNEIKEPEPETIPTAGPGPESMLDTPIGDEEPPLPMPGEDRLPEVLGKQTGEPPVDNGDSIMDMEIDMGSDTIKDVLPIPPKNARDAIDGEGDNGDIMNQRVDSGFGGDSPEDGEVPAPNEGDNTPPAASEDPLDAPIDDEGNEIENKNDDNDTDADDDDEYDEDDEEPVKENTSGILSEAIVLGDEGEGQQQTAQNAGDAEKPAEPEASTAEPEAQPGVDPATGLATDDGSAAEPQENDVTAAVKDKVAEAEAPVPTEGNDLELMKKLSTLTKGLEDVKKSVMAKAMANNG